MKKLLSLTFALALIAIRPALAQTNLVPGTFYKHLRGNINKTLGITMDLWFNGTEYRGFYYYDSKRIPIYLSGANNPDGTMGLIESVDGESTGSFQGSFATGNLLSGTWRNKDNTKSFPFALVEDYSKGSIPMTYLGVESRVPLLEGKKGDDEPHFDISQFVLIPDASNGGMAAKIQPYYGDSLLGRGTNENKVSEALEKAVQEMAADYLELKEEYEEENSFTLTWESSQAHEIVINDCNILCVSSGGYEYTGGAHGNYGTGYYTVDLATGAFLDESDIFIPGYKTKLQPLLEAKYRQVYDIAPSEPLSEVLFTEHIEPNNNFFVMPNGIGYLYNIYEIQSYAQGAAELFFTWEEIAPYIKADSPIQRVIKAKP